MEVLKLIVPNGGRRELEHHGEGKRREWKRTARGTVTLKDSKNFPFLPLFPEGGGPVREAENPNRTVITLQGSRGGG